MSITKFTIAAMGVCGLLALLPGAVHADEDEETEDLPFEDLHVALVTGEGFQSAEAMMPLAFLTNRGAKVTVVGVEPGKVKAYDNDVHLLVHVAAREADADEFDALVLPGGHAPSVIRGNEAVVDFVRRMYEAGKPVAAICHGPQVLITAGVVADRTMTCYADVAEELTAAGATYEDKPVVRDGDMITSRLPKDIPQWLAAMETLFAEHHED
ncbi:MAG: DJ-1/PfpI/YhbO family deglycase/protease [Phycisphaerae bacterium]|nr:DJ-1/PfpI/YhbO family deglycase/protease [Phycisphaerae bacterium]